MLKEAVIDGKLITYKEFKAEQIVRKGYCCPANKFNPELYEKTPAEVCPKCEHWKKDCIVYGKKRGKWR